MNTRRRFLQTTAALAAGSTILQSCAADSGVAAYREAVQKTWRHTEGSITGAQALQRELVRYATLAASSHNTQCWKFKLGNGDISILPDLSHQCPAVDPDDHHLFVSLGCAAENLVQAAHANGLLGEVHFDAAAGDAVKVGLETTRPVASPLFQAIPRRQCSRVEYDGRQVASEELRMLEQAGRGSGVNVLVFTGAQQDGGGARVCGPGQHRANARSRFRPGTQDLDSLQ